MAHTPGPWKLDEDGFIDGVNEYAGCGSHQCDWNSEDDKALVLAAPELLEALEEIADGDGCNCHVGPGCEWKCKDIARAAIAKARHGITVSHVSDEPPAAPPHT